MLRILLPIAFLLLPFIEIAGFIVVGRRIGLWPTLGLVIFSSVAGALLMRIQGLGVLNRIRQAGRDGGVPGQELLDAAMILLAGLLLLIPGFVTDLIGIALFFPPFRRWIWNRLVRNVVVVDISSAGSTYGSRPPPNRTIDLDEDEFRRDERR